MTKKPQRRSVSPFGSFSVETAPLADLAEAFQPVFGVPEGKPPKELSTEEDLIHLPRTLAKILEAPANDAPQLSGVCHYVRRFAPKLNEKGLLELVRSAFQEIFDRKTELFLVDHLDKEQCEKLGLALEYKDAVLFAKERDILIGEFFAPLTESQPGAFSEFVTNWIETEISDRALHFLDFAAGSRNPTFEYFLLFSHPALARVVNNKALLRSLFDRGRPVLAKLSSPAWEKDRRTALGV